MIQVELNMYINIGANNGSEKLLSRYHIFWFNQ